MKPILDRYYSRAYTEIVRNSSNEDRRTDSGDFAFLTEEKYANQVEAISSAIKAFELEIAAIDNRITIRSDAMYFLLTNFDLMVYRPLKFVMEERILLQHINEDVIAILRAAFRDKMNNEFVGSEEIEISGHDIIKAGVKNWDKLKTLFKDSW